MSGPVIPRASKPTAKKVLILGWDAADWKVIEPLIAQGRMPNLAGLMARGVNGNHSTIYPPLSPTLWTSIATGKRPYKHGVLGFTEPTRDGQIRPCSILSRKTKALWNILAQQGKRSIVVGWWPSFPAEPIPGVMVSNRFQQVPSDPDTDLPPLQKGVVHPASLGEEIADLRVRPCEIPLEVLRMFVPKADSVDQTKDKSLHDLASIVAETLSIHAVATDLLEREPWDLAAIYFDAIDHFGHRFMRYHPPRLPEVGEQEFELYKDTVANAYRHHDAMLGRYLELAGPDAHVLVISDHGFHSDEHRPSWIPAEPAGPAVEHRRFGIFVMAGPGIHQGTRIHGSSILDVTPTVLTLFGLPIGGDMDGTPQVQAWVERPEVRRIPSWDDVPGEDGRHPAETEQDPRASAAELEQLVALGYVAPLPEDRQQAVRETVRELDYNRARALADGGNPQQALPILERLWEEFPDEHRFGLHLLDVYAWTGKISERRNALETLRRRGEHYATDAEEKLKALPEEPASDDPVAQRSPARRRSSFERRRLTELSAGLMLARADICQSLLEGDRKAAETEIAPLLDGRQLAPQLQAFVANTLARLGRNKEALALLLPLVQSDPENPDYHSLLTEVYFSSGDWTSSLDSAAQSLGLVYHNPRVHTLLGLALNRLGRRTEAVNQLRVALQQNPRQLEAIVALEDFCQDDPELAFTLANWREETKAMRAARTAEIRRPAPADNVVEYDFSVNCGATPICAGPLQSSEVIIVSGLPRSGTSMLMRLLQGGGVSLLVDGVREADENNRLGYFEFEKVKSLAKDSSWIAQAGGKAVKIVTPLLRHLPATLEARVLVVHRPLSQVLASQEAMKGRLGTGGRNASAALLSERFSEEMQGLDTFATGRPGWKLLHVSYESVLAEPRTQCERIARFLGSPNFNPVVAATCVDPSQRRFS